jgi:hypothetical protein
MTPFAQFVLADALILTLLVSTLVWLFRASNGSIWFKIALALVFAFLVCWSPIATRAILGTPQPRSLAELPDIFQLLAEHTSDDTAFDLWIATGQTPLAITITPDANMRRVLRDAQQRLGQGQPVFIQRQKGKNGHGEGKSAGSEEGQASGQGHAADNGSIRTHFHDDQDRFVLTIPDLHWRKDGP